jgi:hypothetical protein
MPGRFRRTSESARASGGHSSADPAKQRPWMVCVQPVERQELTFEELMRLTRERPEDHG